MAPGPELRGSGKEAGLKTLGPRPIAVDPDCDPESGPDSVAGVGAAGIRKMSSAGVVSTPDEWRPAEPLPPLTILAIPDFQLTGRKTPDTLH
mmetsp:Transcript_95861/g.256204  ORF Transcript_95861/g.256204 Transcript_95861/m.256204 type:complete len:92 (-) Transcript_95861:312-587(-)